MPSLRQTVARSATAWIPQVVFRSAFGIRITVFLYHLISDRRVEHVRHLYAYKDTREFEEDVRELKRHYTLISYPEAKRILRGEFETPAPPALITFDDGFRECYDHVRPILEREGVSAVFFVVPTWTDRPGYIFFRHAASICIGSFLDRDRRGRAELRKVLSKQFGISLPRDHSVLVWLLAIQHTEIEILSAVADVLDLDLERYAQEKLPYMTTDQWRELSEAGFTIGAHSISHRHLDRLSDVEIEGEIVESCEIVAEQTGREEVPFAFPFNAAEGIDRDLLGRLQERSPVVGEFFGGAHHRIGGDRILNRIGLDAPPAPYAEPSRDRIHRKVRSMYGRQLLKSLLRLR